MNELILIVDDAKFARINAKKTLQNGGYHNFLEAATAAEAVELFTEHTPDLTLLDITLPDCSDLSLLKQLLEINPNAKIIMNSALAQELVILDSLKLGAVDFIMKPFTEENFLKSVNNAIKMR